VLALAAAGALSAALPSCSGHHRSQAPLEPDSDDPAELGSYGYDPDVDWLKGNGGTASLAAAPNHRKQGSQPSCGINWSQYQSQEIPPDPRFLITDYKVTRINGAEGLQNLRTVIAHGLPIVFGTSLFTDFKRYRGGHAPYVGNGELLRDNTGKKKGHALLIVGYDDHHGSGAVRIQNSWGTRWGDEGFAWMADDSLNKLAQGKGIYVE
jgi:C1A family cysteine protease